MARRLLLDDSTAEHLRVRANSASIGAPIDQTFKMTVVEQYEYEGAINGWHSGNFFFCADENFANTIGYFLQIGPQWTFLFRNGIWVAGSQATAHIFPLGVEKTVRFRYSGGNIRVDVDGVEAINWTDPSPVGAGYYGFSALSSKVIFDDFDGTITESFDGITAGTFSTGNAVGSSFTARNNGVVIEETPEGETGGTVDPLPTQEIFANSPYLPSFPQTIINPAARLQNSDGTTAKTFRAASTNGDVIDGIIVTSTDTSDRAVEFILNTGGVDIVLGVAYIIAQTGTKGTGDFPGLSVLHIDNFPGMTEKSLKLKPGETLKIRAMTAVSSGTAISVVGFGGAY